MAGRQLTATTSPILGLYGAQKNCYSSMLLVPQQRKIVDVDTVKRKHRVCAISVTASTTPNAQLQRSSSASRSRRLEQQQGSKVGGTIRCKGTCQQGHLNADDLSFQPQHSKLAAYVGPIRITQLSGIPSSIQESISAEPCMPCQATVNGFSFVFHKIRLPLGSVNPLSFNKTCMSVMMEYTCTRWMCQQ